MNTLKERLRFARDLRGLSQGELADRAKCSQSTIGNVESGERDTLRNLVMVARVLNCSADWLYDGLGPKPSAATTNSYTPAAYTPVLQVREREVAYLTTPTDPLREELLALFSQLDTDGKRQWLADLGGFVRGRRPHAHGTASEVAVK